MTEHEFNRKMEIEAQMAEDKEREVQRLAKVADVLSTTARTAVRRPATGLINKRVATAQGAVKRPLTPRIGRGF